MDVKENVHLGPKPVSRTTVAHRSKYKLLYFTFPSHYIYSIPNPMVSIFSLKTGGGGPLPNHIATGTKPRPQFPKIIYHHHISKIEDVMW